VGVESASSEKRYGRILDIDEGIIINGVAADLKTYRTKSRKRESKDERTNSRKRGLREISKHRTILSGYTLRI